MRTCATPGCQSLVHIGETRCANHSAIKVWCAAPSSPGHIGSHIAGNTIAAPTKPATTHHQPMESLMNDANMQVPPTDPATEAATLVLGRHYIARVTVPDAELERAFDVMAALRRFDVLGYGFWIALHHARVAELKQRRAEKVGEIARLVGGVGDTIQ
jgi:hypothetical protein